MLFTGRSRNTEELIDFAENAELTYGAAAIPVRRPTTPCLLGRHRPAVARRLLAARGDAYVPGRAFSARSVLGEHDTSWKSTTPRFAMPAEAPASIFIQVCDAISRDAVCLR
jgi:hypothetical protein